MVKTSNMSDALGLAEAIVRAVDNAHIGLTIAYADTADPAFVYVGEAAARIMGRSVQSLMEQGPFATLPPAELERMRERRQERIRGERLNNNFEAVIERPDGTMVPLELHVTDSVLDDRPVLVTFFHDISIRRQALAELERSEARFRSLIESAPDPVWIFDGRRLRFVNPAAVKILGYPDAATLLALDPRHFVAPDMSASVGERTRQMLETGVSLPPIEYMTRRFDGTYVAVEVGSIPIDFEGGRALLSFGRDMTERKRLQAQLAQTERLTALGTMTAGMAHEINNPLTYTLMGLDVAATHVGRLPPSPATEAARAALHDAREGAERVAAIVSQMRAFSRVDREAVSTERVDLIAVLESAIKMARHEILHRARLITRLAPVPVVLGARERFGQVFVNLLVNAAQALPDDPAANHEIEITAGTDVETGFAVVEVRDTGAGIPTAALPHIFDPFFTTKPVGLGTGLGLAICHGIITAAGGTIGARPSPLGGTILRVALPPAPTADELDGVAPGASDGHPPAPRRRVLVVDDEVSLGTMIERLLTDVHHVATAASADAALALLEREPYDVILCDLMMPGRNGMDLHADVTRRWPGLERRFVFMTGGTFTPRATEFLSQVPNPRLDKPMPYATLLRVIEETALS